jgi:hypothetical protein
MPDSAVNPARQVADPVDPADPSGLRPTGAASAAISRPASERAQAVSDADAKLARAARSAQRLAVLSRAPYGAPTLDLFAEDAERATLQALNTDIRQSSLPGFELPEAFMAAVPSEDNAQGLVRPWRSGVLSTVAALHDDAAALQTDSSTADAATLDLVFDDVVPPVESDVPGDDAQQATAVAASGEGSVRGSGKRASAARARGAARNVSMTAPSPLAAVSEVESADGKRSPGDADSHVATGTPEPATAHKAPPSAATRHREQPRSLAAALIDDDRRTRSSTASASHAHSHEASELDTARATAYADTIDALHAVIADQRGAAAALSRRVKVVLIVVIAVLLVTVAAGVMQTLALAHLTSENTAQQQRLEQLMLNQQATLASFFDTDSDTIEIPNRGNGSPPAANKNPDSAPHSRAVKRAQSKPH